MTNVFTCLMKKKFGNGNGSGMDRESIGNGPVKSRKLFAVLFCLLFVGVGQMWGADLFELTSYASAPTGWDCSNIGYPGGGTPYFKFDNNGAYMISPLYDPHNSVQVTCSIATYGSGTDHALTVQLLDKNGTVKDTKTTAKPSSSSYISSGTLSFGNVGYQFRIKFYLATTGKGVRLRVPKCTGTPITTVTPSPTSITFDADQLDGSGEASGSTTLDISVTNGYKSDGNYLVVAVESDDTECEFTVNSGAYSYGSGNSTSIDDLSVEYYAIDAGTWTGRVIASGYNSSYAVVNCTIPLSVTITAGCSYQVALTKGSESNGTFSLSESNGSYDNCDESFVVTVSSIAPSSGYGCTGVTATGGNSTVTGPDGSGNYTVTYTKDNSITSTVTANFAEKVKTPTFGVSGGTYNATQSVTLSCATDGATIYYTTDGTTPTTSSSVYSSAISVTTTNTTIKAIAAKSSMANSDVASATYVLKCATPEISPATGTYTGAQSVTITCATAGASIYYTNNGGTPSSSSTSYSAFSVDATKTIKAIAIKSGWTDSEIATSTITVQYGITWKVNGVAWTPKTTTGKGTDGSSLVNSGTQWSTLTLPTDPTTSDGCGDKFMGWITETITGELDKTKDAAAITALDILNSGNQSGKTSETITGTTTFHAVFADYAE